MRNTNRHSEIFGCGEAPCAQRAGFGSLRGEAFPLPGPHAVGDKPQSALAATTSGTNATGKVDQEERRRLRRRGIAPNTAIDSLCACGRESPTNVPRCKLQSRKAKAGSALSATDLRINSFARST